MLGAAAAAGARAGVETGEMTLLEGTTLNCSLGRECALDTAGAAEAADLSAAVALESFEASGVWAELGAGLFREAAAAAAAGEKTGISST